MQLGGNQATKQLCHCLPDRTPGSENPGYERIFSIDVFRGMTILAMVFANELDMAMIRNVPWWLKHAKFSSPNPDFMTFVDLIAPAFLFVVGLSVPFALSRRQRRGEPPLRTWTHILLRTAGLMLIGIGMGNMRATDVLRNSNIVPIGLTHASWSVLLLGSFILVWNDYPRAGGWKRILFLLLRIAGLAMLVCLALVYRQIGRHGDLTGLRLRWYVVGMIGWGYLIACIVWALCRRRPAGIVGCMALLIALDLGDRAGAFNRFHVLDGIRHYVPFGSIIGLRGAMTVTGLFVGTLLLPESSVRTPRSRLTWILTTAAILYAVGFLLRPLYGLSTPRQTPTWVLYSLALCCLIYAILYSVTDVWRLRRWAGFTLPAGRNPLVPYFLAFMLHPLTLVLRVGWLNDYLNAGLPGILRTAGITILLGIVITAGLSRLHVRLRL